MKIIKKIGKKTLTYIFMLAFVILTSYYAYVTESITLLTFILVSFASVILGVLNIMERRQNIQKEVSGYLERAEDAIGERQLKSALLFYDEALFLNEKCIQAQIGKGRCFRVLTEYSKAVEEFKKALTLDIDQKTEAEVCYNIGACLMEQGNRKEADVEFSKVNKLDPYFIEVLPYQAEIRHFAGDNQEAFRLLEKYLDRCPNGRRQSVLQRMTMFDPDKVKKYLENDTDNCEVVRDDSSVEEPVVTKLESQIKSPVETEPESDADEEKEKIEEENADKPPVDGGYSDDDFILPTYMKREDKNSAVAAEPVPAPPVEKTTLEIIGKSGSDTTGSSKPFVPSMSSLPADDKAREMPKPKLVIPAELEVASREKPASAGAILRAVPVEEILNENIRETSEPAPSPKPSITAGPARAISVEDVMEGVGFVDDAPTPAVSEDPPRGGASVVVRVKAQARNSTLPDDLTETLKKIKEFAQIAGKLDIDPMLRWSAFSYLNRLTGNIRRLYPQAPAFARQFSLHKLNMLEKFQQEYKKSNHLECYFNDVFVSLNNIGTMDTFNVLRSSQPSVQDLDWLINQAGVRVVINLCHENQVWPGYTLQEEKDVCNEFAVDYYHFSLENWDDPTLDQKQITKILDIIDFHAKPVFLHSSNGADRAGIVAAAYRITRLKWSLEDALDEAQKFGFNAGERPNNLKLIESFI